MPRTLDLDLLRSFVTVAELGGFTRAGTRLGRTQSAVSLQIKRLEEQVGVPLIARGPRHFALTGAGRRLLPHARQMLRMNDAAMAELVEPEVAGLVRLGVPEDFATAHLPEVLAEFTDAHPKVELEVTCDFTLNLEQAFRAGRFDLVLVKREPEVALTGMRVWREPLIWVARDHLSVPADGPLLLIASPEPCVYRHRAIAALEAVGRPWRCSYTSTSLAGTQAAVRAGLGVAVLPREMCPDTLTPVPEGVLPALADTEIALIEAPGASHSARRFAQHIAQALERGA
ncbi:LysR family transcriptional regulator [Erythrobacteraceae bacterium CFH 75059]|uniref:LysR substrate-binding domain-containing protein n=1 Tax=Qipengyuania thermophila TaxID=2509361 RepID=UPI00102284D6|nr:LysR substrate-binding domain-containing protein [Qipengyuania thermophila]TCD04354.1 LysR family transcriptional regulator [Erythrobacteraceae bacterium CFH 75059]